MKNKIKVGSRVRITEDIDEFKKGHEFRVYGSSYRGWDLVDDNGNKMDECLFIQDKIEIVN